jgi:hypothetical protein
MQHGAAVKGARYRFMTPAPGNPSRSLTKQGETVIRFALVWGNQFPKVESDGF